MTTNITISEINQPPVIAIVLATIGFVCYWFLSVSNRVKNMYFKNKNETSAWMNYILFQKVAGFFFLGMMPYLVVISCTTYDLASLGFNLNDFKTSLFYTTIVSVLILVMNYFASKKEDNLKSYPQTRITEWNVKLFLRNCFAWTIYMIGYEFLFRGFLLFICYHQLGAEKVLHSIL